MRLLHHLTAMSAVLLLGSPAVASAGSFPTFGSREWPMYGQNGHRTFNQPSETKISPETVGSLILKWVATNDQSTTATPTVAWVDRDNDGIEETKAVFVGNWNGNFYAMNAADGSRLWQMHMKDRSKPPFGPFVTQALVVKLPGETQKRLYVGAAHILYCLDAATGAFLWRFDTVSETTTAVNGPDPSNHTITARELESSPVVYTANDGKTRVYFGMDVNEVVPDNGAFYAIDAYRGTLDQPLVAANKAGSADGAPAGSNWKWVGYFDPKDPSINRQGDGTGSIWSSPSIDEALNVVYFDSSGNAGTGGDTNLPFNESAVALDASTGALSWSFTPRRFDPADLDFGATPVVVSVTGRVTWPDITLGNVLDVVNNLPRVQLPGASYDKVVTRNMVLLSGKDGVQYALDSKDGGPPWWQTKVVQGSFNGGIIGSASVMTYTDPTGTTKTRIFSGSAVGGTSGPFPPVSMLVWDPIGLGVAVNQHEPNDTSIAGPLPAFRAVDVLTGRLAWNAAESNVTFGPTTSANGVVFQQDLSGILRAYDAETGAVLWRHPTGGASASSAAVSDGEIFIGSGIYDAPAANAIYAFCLATDPACQASEPPH